MCRDCHMEIIMKTTTKIANQIGIPALGSILADYTVFDFKTAHRKHFLWNVLMSTDSAFRRFTYFYNGKKGNIGQKEDIADRVLSFL